MIPSLLLALLACGDEAGHAPGADAGHGPGHGEEAGHAGKIKGGKSAPSAPPTSSPASPAQRVAFVEPSDGAKVKGPFTVRFAVEGMSVHPAGELQPNTGHHHLIIDGGPIPAGTVVPMDDKHLHFGKGQTDTRIELPPGEHRLTMQFADGNHVSYGEAMSATIRVVAE